MLDSGPKIPHGHQSANKLVRNKGGQYANIRLQLAATRAIIYELDTAQETRPLTATELQRRKELKQRVLGLASLSRTMAR
jgi:hypothetical protein